MCQLTLATPGPDPALVAATRSQQLAVIPATSRDTFSPDIQVALGQGAGAQAQVGRESQEIGVCILAAQHLECTARGRPAPHVFWRISEDGGEMAEAAEDDVEARPLATEPSSGLQTAAARLFITGPGEAACVATNRRGDTQVTSQRGNIMSSYISFAVSEDKIGGQLHLEHSY